MLSIDLSAENSGKVGVGTIKDINEEREYGLRNSNNCSSPTILAQCTAGCMVQWKPLSEFYERRAYNRNQHPLHGNVGERKAFPGQIGVGRGMRGALTVGGPLLILRAIASSFLGFFASPCAHIVQSSWASRGEKSEFAEKVDPRM